MLNHDIIYISFYIWCHFDALAYDCLLHELPMVICFKDETSLNIAGGNFESLYTFNESVGTWSNQLITSLQSLVCDIV